MTESDPNPKHVLRSIWTEHADGELEIDADCSPTKQCRNMRDITFEGFAARPHNVAEHPGHGLMP